MSQLDTGDSMISLASPTMGPSSRSRSRSRVASSPSLAALVAPPQSDERFRLPPQMPPKSSTPEFCVTGVSTAMLLQLASAGLVSKLRATCSRNKNRVIVRISLRYGDQSDVSNGDSVSLGADNDQRQNDQEEDDQEDSTVSGGAATVPDHALQLSVDGVGATQIDAQEKAARKVLSLLAAEGIVTGLDKEFAMPDEPFWSGVAVPYSESLTTEFKHYSHMGSSRILSRIREAAMRYIGGFLNSQGGRLMIGIDDDGIVQGTPLTDEQTDNVRQVVASVMHEFHPVVGTEQVSLYFHPVFDLESAMSKSIKLFAPPALNRHASAPLRIKVTDQDEDEETVPEGEVSPPTVSAESTGLDDDERRAPPPNTPVMESEQGSSGGSGSTQAKEKPPQQSSLLRIEQKRTPAGVPLWVLEIVVVKGEIGSVYIDRNTHAYYKSDARITLMAPEMLKKRIRKPLEVQLNQERAYWKNTIQTLRQQLVDQERQLEQAVRVTRQVLQRLPHS